jgi:hypothetical protein
MRFITAKQSFENSKANLFKSLKASFVKFIFFSKLLLFVNSLISISTLLQPPSMRPVNSGRENHEKCTPLRPLPLPEEARQ